MINSLNYLLQQMLKNATEYLINIFSRVNCEKVKHNLVAIKERLYTRDFKQRYEIKNPY